MADIAQFNVAIIRVLLLGCLALASHVTMAEPLGGDLTLLGGRGQHISAAGLVGAGLRSAELLKELEAVSKRDRLLAPEGRVAQLEEALDPMFVSMPKDAAGRLDGAAARYLLHRLFSKSHGWTLNGLHETGGLERAGERYAFFEDEEAPYSGGESFALHDVAVFAATLESLVQGERVERLQTAYSVLGLRRSDDALLESEAVEVARAYMVMLTTGANHSSVSRAQFNELYDHVESRALWASTDQFRQAVLQRVAKRASKPYAASWDNTLQVIEDIEELYVRRHAKDCADLKRDLLQTGKPGTGHVRLKALHGDAKGDRQPWLLDESLPSQWKHGVLDDSDPQHPSVIIPNYRISPANCVASSRFYSVCCVDECDALLGALEERIGAPHAPPARVAELVESLSSDTMQAPRVLSADLLGRLLDISAHHRGRVPLHGRLFAQWLHHVYPRECPLNVDPASRPMPGNGLTREAYDVVHGSWSADAHDFVTRPRLPDLEPEASNPVGRQFLLMAVSLIAAIFVLWLRLQDFSQPINSMEEHAGYRLGSVRILPSRSDSPAASGSKGVPHGGTPQSARKID